MIKGKSKTETTYRELNLDSYTSLKDFSFDRKKYYRKYVLNEVVEEDDSKASLMGKLVETLLMEEEEFDNRFFMSSCAKAPTGLMLEFVEALYRHTKAATDENDNVTKDFSELAELAYKDSGFKIKLQAVIDKFKDSDNEIYYKEIRTVRSKGLSVVTVDDVKNAEKNVEDLRTNPITADIVNLVNSDRYEILNQFQIEDYQVDGLHLKSMLDKVIVDHKTQMIDFYDLKCVWAVENFFEEYYLYRRAYIQARLYMEALKSLTGSQHHPWYRYHVKEPKFIVCDSTGYYSPLIYEVDNQSLSKAYYGFNYRGKEYPGVQKIIKDLQWAVQNDKWNISRQNYIANGKVMINQFYGE